MSPPHLRTSFRRCSLTTRYVPLIILVAIPAVMTLVMALVSTLAISFGNGLDTVFLPISTDEIPIIGPIYGLDVILICISVAYGVFPILYNNLGQLKKYGKDKTKEYRLVKKILSIEIPLVMVLGIFFVAYFSPILKDFYLPEDGLAGLVVNYLFNLVYYVAFAALRRSPMDSTRSSR